MAENPLLKKLRLKANQKVLLLNAEHAWETLFPLENPVDTQANGKYDFILVFAPDKATLEQFAPILQQGATAEAIVWVAYYKGSSKIQTDLTRDKGWESMPETIWQPLSLISLDEKWSAFSFRLAGDKPVKGRRSLRETPSEPMAANPFIDSVKRVITLPEDLAEAFAQNETAAGNYEKLSFTNRKEYVVWVTEAKRPETRQTRVQETVKKLEQGLKNPREKALLTAS
ncbi:YdeI/OmpD-associated family protein [Adhaeribacter soli]|uniref:YdeI/OmpD-associated family protein n=1 Tax=Adhaeribacter soli TaxID=2607655 RepID=A0A5N1J2L8_9BACT|nr:YdeI/OmpD-associated family protein [Adhaeribacter soli]KAA9340839.1 YdeI/OmpD-associated family protein [Adhaeribacter soli]